MTGMLIVLICCLIPLMSGAGLLMGRQLAKANRRRMEQYRASPESHILNLRDRTVLWLDIYKTGSNL
jgi:hypothetical protein